MCFCANSKTKPREPMHRSIVSSTIPKSTVLFSAYDYDGKSFTEQAKFATTQKVSAYANDKLDRDSHYQE